MILKKEKVSNRSMDRSVYCKCVSPGWSHRGLYSCRCAFVVPLNYFAFLRPCFKPVNPPSGDTNPQFSLKEMDIYCWIYLELNTTASKSGQKIVRWHSFNNAGEMPGHIENTMHRTPWETCRGTNAFCFFFFSSSLYPSHIYFIRCILHRLHGGRMAMRSDTHT